MVTLQRASWSPPMALPSAVLATVESAYIWVARISPWMFLIAEVKYPILGEDFLRHSALVIDVDSKTSQH